MYTLTACTAGSYKRSADEESYQAIAEKADLVPGVSNQVVIDEEKLVDLSRLIINSDSFDFLDKLVCAEILFF